jgi:hypothetical protein
MSFSAPSFARDRSKHRPADQSRFIMDVPTYHKVLIVTDAAINIAPTLEDKVDICQNAIDLADRSGWPPQVAILAAVETVSSKMPATIDAAALCKMADRGQITAACWMAAGVRQRHQPRRAHGSRAFDRTWPAIPTSCCAGSRGWQHAGEATELPGERRLRLARARGARAHHPYEPRRQHSRQIASACGCGHRAHTRRQAVRVA